ncbi:MAG: putative rane protein [Frankiales bacterium]|nr:putative rane protein [Frankiales bacterium]
MRRYTVSLLLLLVLIGLWELATPLLAAPDEPQHLVKAAAVARGEWIGRGEQVGPITRVSLPAGFTEISAFPRCFAFKPRRSAACTPPVTAHGGPAVEVGTTAGRYPPAYYALTGLPTLVVQGVASDRAARVVSGLLCALLLAAAITWCAGDLAALAVLFAVTPMVLFLSAVVNPSGVEVAAAVASWAALIRLVRDQGPVRRKQLLALTAVLSALVLARPISPLWLLLIAGCVGVLAPRTRLVELARARGVQLAAAVVMALAACQTAWVVIAQSTRLFGKPVHVSRSTALDRLLSPTHIEHLGSQMIGRFGWLDTAAPLLTQWVWAVLGVLVLVVGLASGRPRARVAVLLALALAVLVPALVEASSFPRIGYWWQGRYSLPLAVGVPLLALAGRRPPRRLLQAFVALLAAGVAVGEEAAFANTLARYTVGTGHGLGLGAVHWQPPLPPLVLVVGFGLAVLAWAAWSSYLALHPTTA